MIESLNLESEVQSKPDKTNIWNKIFKKEKLKKPNKVSVMFKRINGNVEPLYVEVKKGMMNIYDKTYHENDMHRWNLVVGKEHYPHYDIYEKGLLPEGNADFYKKLQSINDWDQVIAEHQDLAIKAIRHAELVRIEGEGLKVNNKWIIGIVIAAIIAFAVLKQYI